MKQQVLLQRIRSLQAQLPVKEVDAFLIENPCDIFYLTGLEASAAKLVVDDRRALLFLDGRYEQAGEQLRFLERARFSCQESFSQDVAAFMTPKKILGLDGQHLCYQNFCALQEALQKAGIACVSLASPVMDLRAIKDDGEMDCIRKSALLADQGISFICSLLRDGISEKEVADELAYFWRKKGAEKESFDSIIAFGEHTSMPHYRPQERRLKKGDAVLMDIGCQWRHYCSDMTRVVFWQQCLPPMQELYEIVCQVQKKAIEACRPGVLTSTIESLTRALFKNEAKEHLFSHSLGHGIGLQVHEKPLFRTPTVLQPGMVVTIEPGLYLPGTGGVRIEDMVLITKDGYEVLTHSGKQMRILCG